MILQSDSAAANSRRVAVVTGAAGFVGRHLVAGLVKRGWAVRAVDLRHDESWADQPGVSFVPGDIRDRAALQEIVTGADTVFHLASAHLQVHAAADWYSSVNVDAITPLVEACSNAGVRRMVHTSSVGIYGHVPDPPADEGAPKHPGNEYERTKLEGEIVAMQEARRKGLDLIVLRPGWVYGSGCPRTEKLLRTIRKGRFVYIGGGDNLRHPVHTDDMVEAFDLAAAAPATASDRAYLIVGPRAVTVRELVETCARVQNVSPPRLRLPRTMGVALGRSLELGFGLLHRDPPFSRRSLAFFDNDNAFDGRLAATHLGFEAQIDLDEGMARTAAAMARAGVSV